MAAGFPATRARIEARGFPVRAVDLTELQKAEAAGSCMSLVFTG
jgi:N-dimethylarginine dimethylaminohydrolase